MLKLFHEIFGQEFLSHVTFIITRWSYRQKDIEDREEEGSTEELKNHEINEELVELGIRKPTDKPVETFFINNRLGMSNRKTFDIKKFEEQEIETHEFTIKLIRDHVE